MSPRRLLLAAVVLVATAVASLTLEASYEVGGTFFARAVPLEFDGWTGTDIGVPDVVFEVLETDDVVTLRFRRGEDEVVLTVAASRSDRRVAHPPEVCMSAEGYEIQSKRIVEVPGLPTGAVHLDSSVRGERQQILYWYLVDGRPTASFLDHQVRSVLKRLRRGSSVIALVRGGSSVVALVRVSTTGPRGSGLERLKAFTASLAPELARVVGHERPAGSVSPKLDDL